MNPQFLNLCRWTSNKANCLDFETAIVTEEGIKVCWNADTISNFDKNFVEIKYEVELKRKKIEKKMNCSTCNKNENCLKCVYPHPLDHKQFCINSYNRSNNAGHVISSFNAIKELLFKPISLYDF